MVFRDRGARKRGLVGVCNAGGMVMKMRSYLSFGGGVNSVAMLLLLLDKGWEFESVYVDHGCDWPETREYVAMMAERYPITILKPEYEGFNSLYDYAWWRRITPSMRIRWCTSRFKVRPLHTYFQKPCFELIGIDAGEAKRAKISVTENIESRYPLIEYDLNRESCIEIIKIHGLPVPRKSGCFICPFQRGVTWRELRRTHPDLFCKAVALEKRAAAFAIAKGKKPFYLKDFPLESVVNERQSVMWGEMKPPCSCGL